MKKTVMLIIVLSGFLLSFSPAMGDKDKSEGQKDKPKVSDRAARGERGRGGRRGQDSVAGRFKGLQDKHDKLVGELGKILKVANEEGASKTAKRVGALIASLNKDHAKVLKRYEQARGRAQKQRRGRENKGKPKKATEKQGKKDSKDE